jgi:hypothetical protein
MTQTLPRDKDGDYPPISIVRSVYAAQEWDKWKTIKYSGKQKAQSAVLKYHSP